MARALKASKVQMKSSEMETTESLQVGNSQVPTVEQISHRAYELYLARGAEDGQQEQDWFQAEQELRKR